MAAGDVELWRAVEQDDAEAAAVLLLSAEDCYRQVRVSYKFFLLRGEAWHVAAQRGARRVIEHMLGLGAEVERRCPRGGTALHYAARWGQAEVIELLLASGANVNAVTVSTGQTPLALTKAIRHAERADPARAKLLLKAAGGRLNEEGAVDEW